MCYIRVYYLGLTKMPIFCRFQSIALLRHAGLADHRHHPDDAGATGGAAARSELVSLISATKSLI